MDVFQSSNQTDNFIQAFIVGCNHLKTFETNIENTKYCLIREMKFIRVICQ